MQILHIIQEALSNVRKHAGASALRVTLRRGPVYTFQVSDDGRGFETGSTAASELHVGLKIMQEQARRAGASVVVESGPGRGTRVTLTVAASCCRSCAARCRISPAFAPAPACCCTRLSGSR